MKPHGTATDHSTARATGEEVRVARADDTSLPGKISVKRKPAGRMVAARAVLGLMWLVCSTDAPAHQSQPSATNGVDGAQILNDAGLFPAKETKTFNEIWQRTAKMNVGSVAYAFPIKAAPALEAIEKKYGAAERTEERAKAMTGPPTDVVVYWYGKVGFGVPKDVQYAKGKAQGKVIWAIRIP